MVLLVSHLKIQSHILHNFSPLVRRALDLYRQKHSVYYNTTVISLLINDIDLQLIKSNIILYADDTVIFTSDKNSKEVPEKLNNDLKYLGGFFVENNLVVNLKKSKTEFMLFGSHQKLAKADEIKVNINNHKIVKSDRYEYLGVQLDDNLNMLSQFEKMYKKVS